MTQSERDRKADEFARTGPNRNPISFYEFRHDAFLAGWDARDEEVEKLKESRERLVQLEFTCQQGKARLRSRLAFAEKVVTVARSVGEPSSDTTYGDLFDAIRAYDQSTSGVGGEGKEE